MENVKINEKNYTINFGMAALQEFCKNTDTPLGDIADRIQVEPIEFIYIALKHGARRAKKEFDIEDSFELADMLDDDPDGMQRVTDIMVKSLATTANSKKKKSKAAKK